jgi:hypothetical protein
MKLNEHAGRLIARSAKEAKRLAAAARASARGRGARAKLTAANKLDELASRCQKVAASSIAAGVTDSSGISPNRGSSSEPTIER